MVRRAHTIGFAVVLVCLAGVVGSASGMTPPAATGPGSAAPPDPSGGFGVASDRFASTTFEITVYANGSIRWTTIYTKPLNESEVADFESFAREFNTTETDLYRSFTDLGTGLARVGTNRTNRTMEARSFDRLAYVDRSALSLGTQGRVEMSFVLTNLSRVTGQRVVLGDVFDGGLYLKPSQKLVVEPGPGLAFETAEPSPDSKANPGSLAESDSVTWEGERDFNDERPYVVLVPPSTLTTVGDTTTATTTAVRTTDATGGQTQSPTATDTTVPSPGATTTESGAAGPPAGTTPGAEGGGSGGTMLVVGLIVLLLGAGTVAVWRVTTGEDDGGVIPTPGDDGSGTDQPATTRSPEAPAQPPAGESEAPAEQAAPEEELLTDSDRVQRLLDDNGGRMRQSAIVEETDWSKSKVSMLLSDMEDDDEITKLRVGRENIISLPGHEPDAAGSPFEDEE